VCRRRQITGMANSHVFRVIDGPTIHEILSNNVQACLDAVRQAYVAHSESRSVNPASVFLRFPERPQDRIIALPAHLGAPWNVSGIKWIASYPGNVRHGLPRASAVLLLNDAECGFPFACLEGSLISAARTAASAVLAADHLCPQPRKVQSLGIVGTGFIARYIYRFLVADGWRIDRLSLFDANPAAARAFSQEEAASGLHSSVTVADSVVELLACSDLVVFATTAPKPHVSDPRTIEHRPVILHVSLRDLAPELLLQSWNVVDDIDHVMKSETSPHLAERLSGSRSFVTATIADLFAKRWLPDHSRSIIFSPFGLGILDLSLGKWVYDRALAAGRCHVIRDFLPI
jgi:2,3-diaminopropionate biosynthesis protein SbnB